LSLVTNRLRNGGPPPQPELRKARLSTAACFFVFGALLSTWVSRIPVIQHALGLNDAQLGLALLGAPIGQVVSMQVGTGLVSRWTSAVTARRAAVACAIALSLLGLARSPAELAGFLVLLGLALGTLDIAMNTQGVAVERGFDRPILSGLHGVYNVGVLAGALLGSLAAGLGIDPLAHFIAAAAIFSVVTLTGTRSLLGPVADATVEVDVGDPNFDPARGRQLRHHPVLVAAGVVAFCSFFAEGAVDNWSGVFLHQVRNASYGLAPLGIALCGIGMAIGRFLGDAIITRWGRAQTLVCAGLVASAGLSMSLLGTSVVLALCGYAIFGIGAATIVPIAFTIAGNTPNVSPPWALSRVSTMGYLGQLTSPAIVGLVAHATSLSWALAIPAVLCVAVVPLSRVARRR
jgi:predicted MFS family arabinose efflux permease